MEYLNRVRLRERGKGQESVVADGSLSASQFLLATHLEKGRC